MPTVSLEPEAYLDIQEAQDWYEDQDPGLGARFESYVNAALDWISGNIGLCREVRPGVHVHLVNVFPYLVYFRLVEGGARVFAVIHSARNPRIVWRRLAP